MACLTENQLLALFAPEATPRLRAEADAHTATCARCRELVAQFAQMSAENGTAHTQRHASGISSGPGAAVVPSLTPGIGVHSTVAEAPPAAPPYALKLVGTLLKGKWRIEKLLGYGGMAFVFAAVHRNGRRVAVKCMRPDLVTEPSLVERFLREGYVANKIAHPGAVAILDDDVMEDGTPFLVMELLTGRSLRQRLAAGRLPVLQALDVAASVLDVLAVAHDEGIVHRDLKPDNLFQTEDGTVKVLDFGIARLREHTRSQFETQTGTTMGTVGFMPPEQARGLVNEIDARSDVWAIGATMYSLLTGRSLHEAATPNEALLLAMTTPVPPMQTLLPGLPGAVQAVMDRALAFKKDDRFPSARAMKEALDAARAQIASLPAETMVLGDSRPPPPMGAMASPVPMAAPRMTPPGALGGLPPVIIAATPAPAVTAPAISPAEPTPSMMARAMARRGPGSIPPASVSTPAAPKTWLVVGGAALVAAVLGVGVVAAVRGDGPTRTRDSATRASGTPSAGAGLVATASSPPVEPATLSTGGEAPSTSAVASAPPPPAETTAASKAVAPAPRATTSAKPRATTKPVPVASAAPAVTTAAPATAQPTPAPATTRDPLGQRR